MIMTCIGREHHVAFILFYRIYTMLEVSISRRVTACLSPDLSVLVYQKKKKKKRALIVFSRSNEQMSCLARERLWGCICVRVCVSLLHGAADNIVASVESVEVVRLLLFEIQGNSHSKCLRHPVKKLPGHEWLMLLINASVLYQSWQTEDRLVFK